MMAMMEDLLVLVKGVQELEELYRFVTARAKEGFVILCRLVY
jgi:hypothetical protein